MPDGSGEGLLSASAAEAHGFTWYVMSRYASYDLVELWSRTLTSRWYVPAFPVPVQVNVLLAAYCRTTCQEPPGGWTQKR